MSSSLINSYHTFKTTLDNAWNGLHQIEAKQMDIDDDSSSNDVSSEISIDEGFIFVDQEEEQRTLILHQICLEIFTEKTKEYIEQWIQNDPNSAEERLMYLEKKCYRYVPTDCLAIHLAQMQLKAKEKWECEPLLFPNLDSLELLEKIFIHFDAKTFLTISRLNKTFNKSKFISVKILGREELLNSNGPFRLTSIFYRHLINAGKDLSDLAPLHLSNHPPLELQNCIQNECPKLRSFRLLCTGEEEEFAANFSLLPQNLTELSYEGELLDLSIGFLPKTLKKLRLVSTSFLTKSDIINLPKLTYLSLSVPIIDFQPKDLPRTLTEFSFVTDSLKGFVTDWPLLQSLAINANKIAGTYLNFLPHTLMKLSITIDAIKSPKLDLSSSIVNDLFIKIPNSKALNSILLPNTLTTLKVANVIEAETKNLSSWNLFHLSLLQSFCSYGRVDDLKFNPCDFTWPETLQHIKLSQPLSIHSSDFIKLPRKLKSFATVLNICHSTHLSDLPPNLETLCLYFESVETQFSFNDLNLLPSSLKHLYLGKLSHEDSDKLNTSILNVLKNLESLTLTNLNVDVNTLDFSSLERLKKVFFYFSTFSNDEQNPKRERKIKKFEEKKTPLIKALREWSGKHPPQIEVHQFRSRQADVRDFIDSLNASLMQKTVKEIDQKAGIILADKSLL